jgi:hypothetical protein
MSVSKQIHELKLHSLIHREAAGIVGLGAVRDRAVRDRAPDEGAAGDGLDRFVIEGRGHE